MLNPFDNLLIQSATGHEPWILALAVLVVSGATLLLLRKLIFSLYTRYLLSSDVRFRGALDYAFRWPSVVWCGAIAVFLALPVVRTRNLMLVRNVRLLVETAVLVSVAFGVVRMTNLLVRGALSRAHIRLADGAFIERTLRGALYVITALVISQRVGIEIAPILTALGIGGFAFAFAMQDTLVNFIAGFSLVLDRSLNVGDRLKLESGHEGVLHSIGWRTSIIRLDTEMLIVPNIRLIQGMTLVKNSNLPAELLQTGSRGTSIALSEASPCKGEVMTTRDTQNQDKANLSPKLERQAVRTSSPQEPDQDDEKSKKAKRWLNEDPVSVTRQQSGPENDLGRGAD